MALWFFIICCILWSVSVALVDGMFNRLIFREHRRLSYFSEQKQAIYKRNEWVFITIFYLILISYIFPSIASLAIGGVKYWLIFSIIFALVDWDIIFGRVVFDDWLGDLPSMKLPKLGWLHTPLWLSIVIRLVIAAVLVLILVAFYN